MTEEVAQVAPIEEEAQVAEVSEVKEEVQEPGKDIADALAKFAGAPSKDQIEGWKQEHGEIFCSGFSEEELLIWRPLKRQEFVSLQTELAETQGTQLSQEERVSEICILWASNMAKSSLVQKAGSCSTLHEQIMFNSNFVDPRIASALVIKL